MNAYLRQFQKLMFSPFLINETKDSVLDFLSDVACTGDCNLLWILHILCTVTLSIVLSGFQHVCVCVYVGGTGAGRGKGTC